jgi:hypothetical protein
MSADSVPSSKTNIFQNKLIYCRHFRTYSRCAIFDLTLSQCLSSGEDRIWSPLKKNTMHLFSGSLSFFEYSSNNNIQKMYFHSSQCRLIPYLHQRPIFFKTNSSIVAILELILGAQYRNETKSTKTKRNETKSTK